MKEINIFKRLIDKDEKGHIIDVNKMHQLYRDILNTLRRK